jgi:hypothetical protein
MSRFKLVLPVFVERRGVEHAPNIGPDDDNIVAAVRRAVSPTWRTTDGPLRKNRMRSYVAEEAVRTGAA